MRIHFPLFPAAVILTASLAGGSAAAAPPARTITISAGDDMKFSLAELRARPGERLRVVLVSTGAMPKVAMAHNVVFLAKGTDVKAFNDASSMDRAHDFVAPSFAKKVLAATGLAGAGETVEVTFNAPKLPSRYDYVCSFPGHVLAGMRGVLVVR